MTKRQKKMDKKKNNDLQSTTKLNIEQHEPHKKTEGDLRCSGRVSSSFSTSGIIMLLLSISRDKS